jgi:adenylate cyclase class IV
MTNEQLSRLRNEAKRFGRALRDDEVAMYSKVSSERIYFDCPLSDLAWDARHMRLREKELTAVFFAATEPPAIWVHHRPDGKYFLQDGYHRVAAALRMKKTHIKAFYECAA